MKTKSKSPKLPKSALAYFVAMGAKGGAIGGKAKGKAKRRPAAHYAAMVVARLKKHKGKKPSC